MAKFVLFVVIYLLSGNVFGFSDTSVKMKLHTAVYKNESFINCHQRGLNTSDWLTMNINELAEWQYLCIRIPVEISSDRISVNNLPSNNNLSIVMLASAEIYWDGELVGYKGQPGINKSQEVVGPIAANFPLNSKQLSPGTHLLSMRVSTYHHIEDMHSIYYGIYLNDTHKASKSTQLYLLTPMMLCGAMLILVLFFQLLYWRYSRNNTFIIFSLLSLFSGLLIALEMMKFVWVYPWDFHIIRLRIIIAVVCITAMLMVAFYLFYYRITVNRGSYLIAIAALIFGVYFAPSYDFKSLTAFTWAILLSIAVNVFAIVKKKNNAHINTFVLLLGTVVLIVVPFSFVDKWFAALFALIALANIYNLMNVFNQERQRALTSLKLEAELLRRNLQPHFLMNSLLLVVEWVEQQPKLAVEFINDLALEFSLLNSMSKQQLVSWQQELQLCQLHFGIMKRRCQKDINFKVSTECLHFLLPPALIHTLIENAFSHNKIKDRDLFLLSIRSQDNYIYIELTTPYRQRNHTGTGTGESYISSRLNLCFENDWHYEAYPAEQQWVTEIRIPLKLENSTLLDTK